MDRVLPFRPVQGSWQSPRRALWGPRTVENTAYHPGPPYAVPHSFPQFSAILHRSLQPLAVSYNALPEHVSDREAFVLPKDGRPRKSCTRTNDILLSHHVLWSWQSPAGLYGALDSREHCLPLTPNNSHHSQPSSTLFHKGVLIKTVLKGPETLSCFGSEDTLYRSGSGKGLCIMNTSVNLSGSCNSGGNFVRALISALYSLRVSPM